MPWFKAGDVKANNVVLIGAQVEQRTKLMLNSKADKKLVFQKKQATVLSQLQTNFGNVIGEYLELELSVNKDIKKIYNAVKDPFKNFMISKGLN